MWGPSDFHDFNSPYKDPLESLPYFVPHFTVPALENKPQNPILDTLNLEHVNSRLPKRFFHPEQLPEELVLLTLDNHVVPEETLHTRTEKLWNNALHRELGVKVRISDLEKDQA